MEKTAQFQIDRTISPPSCLPVYLDRGSLIDITTIGDRWRRYLDQRTGKTHDGAVYFKQAQALATYVELQPIRIIEWQSIATAPTKTEGEGRFLVWGRVWLKLDEEGKDDPNNWSTPGPYLATSVIAGVCYVLDGDVSGQLTECRATHWAPIYPPQ